MSWCESVPAGSEEIWKWKSVLWVGWWSKKRKERKQGRFGQSNKIHRPNGRQKMSDRKREIPALLGKKNKRAATAIRMMFGSWEGEGGFAADFHVMACIGFLRDSNTPKTTSS